MTEKLDRFCPPPDVLAGVRRQLINAGIDPESIPEDWLVAIVAAMTKWSFQTPDGVSVSLKWLGAQCRRGLDDYEYEYVDPVTGNAYAIPPEKVMFFAGAAIQGNPIDSKSIITSKKQHSQCDSCGVIQHCVKDLRDPAKDRFVTLCNACLSYNDNPRLSSLGNLRVCSDCTSVACSHHPRSIRKDRLALA